MALSTGASGASVPASEGGTHSSGSTRYEHLQYFGFYASAMAHWNFTELLAPFTNLTWIHLGHASDPGAAIDEIVERLEQARIAGVQAVLSIEPFIFLDRRGRLRDAVETDALLVELRERIEEHRLFDTVAMIYPKDEPFRNFVAQRDPSFIDQHITGRVYSEVHEDLFRANARIKSVFPEIPIGVILSGYDLHHRFFSIPENYDWVGFDCYRSMFQGCSDDKTIVNHYERLLKFMQPHQRLMAVPETWARNEDTDRADWPDILARRFKHHYEIALSDPRFVAFIPFIWSFETSGETPGVGLDRFEELYGGAKGDPGADFVEAVIDTGLQIKHRQHRYPNLAWAETEDHRKRPRQVVTAEIVSVTPGGNVTVWAVDKALPHKNLRVRILLHDEHGRLLHTSALMRTDQVDSGQAVTSVGLHGLRYALPAKVLAKNRGRSLSVEAHFHTDGTPVPLGRGGPLRFKPHGKPQIPGQVNRM